MIYGIIQSYVTTAISMQIEGKPSAYFSVGVAKAKLLRGELCK
jgi:hypothetical protein